jgi:hypothetical protein
MAVSFKGSTGLQGNLPMGGVVQSAINYSYATGSRTFPSRNVYEEVPGRLMVEIRPKEVGNIIIIKAHIMWGGWNGATDVAANFRIFYSTDGNRSFSPFGTYAPHVVDAAGVATGAYFYSQGNADSSYDSDDILISAPVKSTAPHTFAVWWACGYEASSRTLYWNRGVNTGQSYNPTHTCSIQAIEIKGR